MFGYRVILSDLTNVLVVADSVEIEQGALVFRNPLQIYAPGAWRSVERDPPDEVKS